MSSKRIGIATRPAIDPAAHVWVREGGDVDALPKAEVYTARLSVDVSADLRGRIKVLAFQRGITVADMLRQLLEREYGGHHG